MRNLFRASCFLLATACVPLLALTQAHAAPSSLSPKNLQTYLESVRVKYGVPALGAAIILNDQTFVTATGFRKNGDATPVTPQDKWHLGSCTKSMTATLVAMLVEDGKLKWDSTLGEIFPDLKDGMRPEYLNATVRQLLQHRAGLSYKADIEGYSKNYWRNNAATLPAQRLEFTKLILAEAPEAAPGTSTIYSNRGYIVAGAIIERISGQSWEEFIQQRLFDPMGMKSAGFGWMAGRENDGDQLDQPWPHYLKDGQWVGVPPGKNADNPLVVGPAGTVHCSLEDWAKFIRFHMHGQKGGETLLRPETLQLLHTPPADSEYGMDWHVLQRSWGGGNVYTHNGTNGMSCSRVWVAPERNFAVLVVTNGGGLEKVLDEVAERLCGQLSAETR